MEDSKNVEEKCYLTQNLDLCLSFRGKIVYFKPNNEEDNFII